MKNKPAELSQKQLWARWEKNYESGISIRTVRRHVKQFNLPIHRRVGTAPRYLLQEVELAELRRTQYFDSLYADHRDGGSAIISVANAKKAARLGVRGKR